MNATEHGAPRRPLAVSIVAAFLFAATGISIIVGFSLLFPGWLLDRIWSLNPAGAAMFQSIGPISGLFLLMLGAVISQAARGLLHGSKWAWRFTVSLFTVDACGDIVSYFIIHDAIRTITGVMISSAFLYTLCRRHVRDYFFHPAVMLGD
ncbi:MAG: hypothetical protein LAO78_25060 [Acidobacteriia bacterium]|nr:hypothetical protein [Terriglobia bacterium]